MSSCGGIDLLIISVPILIKVLRDLMLNYELASEKKKIITTTDGKIHNVDLVVRDEFDKDIGFQKQKDGSYKIIADSSGLNPTQLKKQKELINKIKRQYAYSMVVQELKKQGYQITEEKKVEKDTVKLTARRWVA